MRILVVSATSLEIAPLAEILRCHTGTTQRVIPAAYRGHDVDVLITGVGMVATAAHCSRVLSQRSYDLALNLGVCGSFDPALGPGTAVHVTADRLAELGAEDGEQFLTVQALNLLRDDEFPFTAGQLVNLSPPSVPSVTSLPTVAGITVNTVHGNQASIDAVVRRFQPQVESMEGAAFMYACLVQKVVFAQIRAVSNMVERRDRESWQLTPAIRSLGAVALDILNQI